ncbi:DUF3138 family protein [Paraburkholderia caffeinilytica]|uniref:DUF3138 family protein n=1 Tax=Paraburkholderia caffeinilytica TaxID=1761016 RepID=UPI0038BC0532
MKRKNIVALCLLSFEAAAVFAQDPQKSVADANRLQSLQAQVNALQAQVDALRASIGVQAAPVANAKSTSLVALPGNAVSAPDASVALSNDEVQQMREQVSNMSLKVDWLEDAATTGPLAGLSITGYIDPVYLYNRAQRSSSFMFLNHDPGVYDYYNSTIGDIYLDIKKTFGVGPLAPAAEIVIQPNRGFGSQLSNEHGVIGGNIVTQAEVTVPFSVTKTFEVGLMTSLAGYEVQPSNQMLALTHGLLYDFSEPGNMVGVGLKGSDATATRFWQVMLGNEQLRTSGAIVNAANNTTKSNWTPTLTARFDNATSTALDVGVSGTIGKQTLFSPCAAAGGYGYQCNASSPFGMYRYVETDLTYTKDKLQLNAQLDYGELQKGAWNGGTARWYGLSLLGHQKWTSAWFGHMGATLRAEYLNNTANGGGGSNILYGLAGGNPAVNGTSGFGVDPGCLQQSSSNGSECKGAAHYDITADLLFYPTAQIIVKLEYRHDAANHPVFLTSNGSYSRNNDTAALQFVYTF